MAIEEGKQISVDIHTDGVLWLINRVVFHPRGFALCVNDFGAFGIVGNGSEVWTFNDGIDDDRFARVEAMFKRAKEL